MAASLVALVVLAVVFRVVETRWPAVAMPRWRAGLRTDLIYWFATPLVSRALAVVAVVVVAVALAAVAGVPLDGAHVAAFARRSRWFGELPLVAQIPLVLAIGDVIGYWVHRAFHRGRLWRFHAIHHSSRELDWLSATRLHPVNDIVARVLQAIPLIALGFDTRVVAAYVPVLALYAIMLHANVRWTFGPMRYVLASPAFHRWHHTSEEAGRDTNFAGLFPVWDLVFGTFHLPRKPATRFGVADPVPDGVIGQLVWPFRRLQPGVRSDGSFTVRR